MTNTRKSAASKNAAMSALQSIESDSADKNKEVIDTLGWQDIARKDIPYQGMLYPESYKFQVLPAATKDIRQYSSLDETNIISVSDALNRMIRTNVRIIDTADNKVIPSTRIYEHERFFWILLIQTYTGGTKTITFEHMCEEDSCQHMNQVSITPYKLMYSKMSAKMLQRWDAVKGYASILTKTLGEFKYRPITLDESIKVSEFMIKRRQNKKPYEANFSKLLPFIRQLDKKNNVSDLYSSYIELRPQVLSFLMRLSGHDFDVRAEQTLEESCEKCECGIYPTIQFPDGIANIFFDDNVDDELLD